MPRTYPATLLDGNSRAETQVEVEPHAGGLRIFDAQGALRSEWRRMALQLGGVQQGPLNVTHSAAAHETLVVIDADLQRAIVAIGPKTESSSGGSRVLVLGGVVLVMLALLSAGVYAATPRIARAVAVRVPLEHERMLGAQLEAALDYSRCADDQALSSLHALTNALTAHDGAGVDVRIVKSETANAFALPGGIVIVNSALLQQAESESEIAGVLAHEIEHVVQRHVLTGVLRDTLLSSLWAFTIGDFAGLLAIDPATAYRIASLRFPRADEDSADRGAVQRLHRAGISHKGMRSFFARVKKEQGALEGPEWLSTHPSTDDRMAQLERTRDLESPKAVLTSAQLAALKAACAAPMPANSPAVHGP